MPEVPNNSYSIFAINDLGMHCGDLDTRISSILPPFQAMLAQIVRVGSSPQLNPAGISLEYSAVSNPVDPILGSNIFDGVRGDGTTYKTNFWDAVAAGTWDAFYPAFNPFDPASIQCPFPHYAQMREEQPVMLIESVGMYLVTNHDLVMQVLRDPATYSSLFGGASMPLPAEARAKMAEVMADGYPRVPTMLTADMPAFFTRYWFPGPPWDHADHYMARSPLSLAGGVTTPTMLLTGEEDYRTPISE